MTTINWIMIAAVFFGPIVAVRLTRYLDEKKEFRARKLDIFKTLMATRSYTVSWDHVQALNKIDVEFKRNNKNEKEIIDAWKAYHDHLSSEVKSIQEWEARRVDFLIELLYKMAIALNYDFDKTHIKNSSYSPMAHGEINAEQNIIRKQLIKVLEGKDHIPIKIIDLPKQNIDP